MAVYSPQLSATRKRFKRIDMKQHPILFSTPMVKAILEGRKTQTRRIIKPQPDDSGLWNDTEFPRSLQSPLKGWNGSTDDGNSREWKCPYGKVGDVLWVRETWAKACLSEDGASPIEGTDWKYWYKADNDWQNKEWHHPDKDGPQDSPKWKPSIHMPKSACRIFLETTDIRAERLQDISEEDAIAEGVRDEIDGSGVWPRDYSLCPMCGGTGLHFGLGENLGVTEVSCETCTTYKKRFKILWQSINGEESWNSNPWVWVISFKQIDKPINKPI
jgi:hypothetical protein